MFLFGLLAGAVAFLLSVVISHHIGLAIGLGLLVFALYVWINLYIGWLSERLGKRGYIWGIVPYNKLLFQEDYGNLAKIYAAPTSDETKERFEKWQSERTDLAGKIIVKKVGQPGRVLLGWPWKSRIRAMPWSEHDRNVDVRHSIFLGDYTLEWGSQHGDVGPDGEKRSLSSGYDAHGVPDYETADPVRVASSLTAIIRAVDYEKFGYRLHYPKDIFRDLILGVWREQVLAKNKFFTEGLGSELDSGREVDVSKTDMASLLGKYQPQILQKAQQELNVALGIADWKEYKDEAKKEPDKDQGIRYLDPHNKEKPDRYPEGTVAFQVFHDYGAQIVRVIVTDLEEVGTPGKEKEKTVRERLEELLKTTVSRRTAIIEADGKAKANIIESRGRRQAFLAEISAFETDPKKRLEAEKDLAKYQPSEQAIRAYLERAGLETLQKLPAKGRSLWFGTPAGKTISKLLSEMATGIETGKDATAEEGESASEGESPAAGGTEEAK